MPLTIREAIKNKAGAIIAYKNSPRYYPHEIYGAWKFVLSSGRKSLWKNKIVVTGISKEEALIITATYLRELKDDLYSSVYVETEKTLYIRMDLDVREEALRVMSNLMRRFDLNRNKDSKGNPLLA